MFISGVEKEKEHHSIFYFVCLTASGDTDPGCSIYFDVTSVCSCILLVKLQSWFQLLSKLEQQYPFDLRFEQYLWI